LCHREAFPDRADRLPGRLCDMKVLAVCGSARRGQYGVDAANAAGGGVRRRGRY
jgi:hypothetical protein